MNIQTRKVLIDRIDAELKWQQSINKNPVVNERRLMLLLIDLKQYLQNERPGRKR